MARALDPKSVVASMLQTAKAPRELINKTGLSPYENPDHVVSTKGLRYLQDHVEKDSHYSSVLGTRISALLKTGWKIQPGSSKVKGKLVVSDSDRLLAEFIETALEQMKGSFEADIMAMMTHISRGFSISEINYKYLGAGKHQGKLGLDSIRFKEQEFYSFRFDEFGNYTLCQVDPEYRDLNKDKFIHFINGFNDENPYGESVAAICAFWVWLKENGAKFWGIFQERFGQPLAILEVPDNMSQEIQKKADEITEAVHESTSIQIPKGMILRYLEALRSGEANHRGFLEFANNEMSKAILGSTLAVDTQKNASGSHALGQEHAAVMGIKFSFDIITSQSAINQQLIKRLIDYNFAEVERYPRFQWNAVNSAGFITFAQGIEALMRSGVRIPASWVHEVLSIPIAENGEEVLEPSSGAFVPVSGVDNKVKNSRDIEGSRGREDFEPQRAQGTQRVVKLQDEATTFEKVEKRHVRIAERQAELNEKIIGIGREEIVRRWEGFMKQTVKTGVFDFMTITDFEEKELSGIYSQFMLISALRGLESAKLESVNGAGGAFESGAGVEHYLYKPFEEIIKEFKKKKIISKREFEELSEAMKRLGFTVARQDSLRVLGKIKADLDEVLAGKDSLPDFYDKVYDLFADCGVLGKGNHIETVLRTNLVSQYNESRMKLFSGLDGAEFPQLCWVIIDDDATRKHHRELDGFTRKKEDQVWSWLRPPLEYNCRCTVRAVHVSEKRAESPEEPDRNRYKFTRW